MSDSAKTPDDLSASSDWNSMAGFGIAIRLLLIVLFCLPLMIAGQFPVHLFQGTQWKGDYVRTVIFSCCLPFITTLLFGCYLRYSSGTRFKIAEDFIIALCTTLPLPMFTFCVRLGEYHPAELGSFVAGSVLFFHVIFCRLFKIYFVGKLKSVAWCILYSQALTMLIFVVQFIVMFYDIIPTGNVE